MNNDFSKTVGAWLAAALPIWPPASSIFLPVAVPHGAIDRGQKARLSFSCGPPKSAVACRDRDRWSTVERCGGRVGFLVMALAMLRRAPAAPGPASGLNWPVLHCGQSAEMRASHSVSRPSSLLQVRRPDAIGFVI